MMLELALAVALLAGIPALNTVWNLWLYRPAPRWLDRSVGQSRPPTVSVLIPARDEERNIRLAVLSALANEGVDLEVLVMDDHSSDRTAEVVQQMADAESRVHLVMAPELPPGWCGKPHACARLADLAEADYLAFIDADVRLAPDALRRAVGWMERTGTDLLSGVPSQITESALERLVVPLIHFILLGYLPMAGMRRWQSAVWAAGCGQLFLARRSAYEESGGHRSIRGSRHDGLTLPRSFRRAGFKTDLFDATDVASCRMYDSSSAVIEGFAKNATEGMASPTAIVPWSALLLGGQVAPFALLPLALLTGHASAAVTSLVAIGLVYGTRFALGRRFRQDLSDLWLHPLGVALIVWIQWLALYRSTTGRSVAWKGRI